MAQILYLFILVVVTNYYLRFRTKDRLSTGEKIAITLMSIALLIGSFKLIALLLDKELSRRESPVFNLLFMAFTMLVLPLLITEGVQQVYSRFIAKKKDAA